MPLNFDESFQGSGVPRSSSSRQVRSARRGPLPKELETEVLPILIRKVGDWKSGRISLPLVENYLDRHNLLFDRDTLRAMFAESDFKTEGSVDRQGIIAALSARYPTRKHNEDWRTLVSLLLGVKTLTLSMDREAGLCITTQRPQTGLGTYNSDSFWIDPLTALPPIKRVGETRSRRNRPNPLSLLHPDEASSSRPQSQTLNTTDTARVPLTDPAVVGTLSPGSLGTLRGCRDFDMAERGRGVNSTLLDTTATATGQGFGFDTTSLRTRNFTGGFLASAGAGASGSTATFLGSPKQAYQPSSPPGPALAGTLLSRLPPTPMNMTPSALQTLRESMRSTVSSKPGFRRMHRGLDYTELDLKQSLGLPLDLERPLSREEPIRGTKVLYNADYVTWCDYSSRTCRTAPTMWYNHHPAISPVIMASEHKYPWC